MSTTTLLKIVHESSLAAELSLGTTLYKKFANNLINAISSIESGGIRANLKASYAEASGVAAHGTVTISSGSGTVSITINGVAFSLTWATSDTVTAAAFATAINASANALISGVVSATSALGVVTITAAEKSKLGNAITTVAAGTGMTANQALLASGVSPVFTTYTYS